MKAHLLVVEDENEIRESIKEILIQSGYDVSDFSDVQSAEKFLETSNVDLIISDIMLPGKSGWDFINFVKENANLSLIPFIFLTAKSEPSELRTGMNFGADDYITKPFRSKDLLTSIKLRLSKKKSFDNKINYFLKSIAEYVPHELRTPLVSILGYPEFMLDNFDELSTDEIKQMLGNIFDAGRRMQETVEKFILFSELESISLSEKVKNIYSKHKTEEMEAIVGIAAKKVAEYHDRKEDLEIDISNSPIKIADYLLSEVIKQVVDNSFKFSAKGSKVRLKSEIKSKTYHLLITDAGKGMNSEQMKNIEAFVQFDREHFNQSGNGLGLALVKKILNLNKNKLLISSRKDEGTTITLIFNIYQSG